MTHPAQAIDPAILQQKQGLLLNFLTGFNQSLIAHIGIELGLYEQLAAAESMTAGELAGALGLHERFVLEWLRASAAGGLLDYAGDGRFRAGPEVAQLFVDEDSLSWMGWIVRNFPDRAVMVPRSVEAFRTGIGHDWDDRGPSGAEMMESGFRAWYRQLLVPAALPALDGVTGRLESGVKVADIGCGAGIALVEMAKAFPRSQFHGYDISTLALARAEANRSAAGLTNLTFHDVRDGGLPPDRSFALVTTFDMLHDMSEPGEAAAAARAALDSDGTWFIADIDGRPTFEENLASNPRAAMQYANSVLGCLQSSMSHPGNMGYGTLGLPEPAMRQLALDAGFTRFRRVDLPSPVNAYYEVRP